MALEEVGYRKRMPEMLGGLLRDAEPFPIGGTGGVGVREDDDLASLQGLEHRQGEVAAAAGGQPYTVFVCQELAADDGGLL